MYREETEYGSNFYVYVGMINMDNTTFRKGINIIEHIDEAIAFRKKSLEYFPNGYELQIIEEAVVTLAPYCDIFRVTKTGNIFMSHYTLSGIHYFEKV